VGLTLDRFGFAYASMMTLKNTPLHRIKIDESLIAVITHDREAQTIVKTTVDLARSYGLQVAADGIETEDQSRWLRYHGCELGRGEYLAGRLAAQELFERLVEQNQ
jgi:EAL domain-containing protein (putative c-di-GMP-specific phosphodiesterase class I)